MGIVLTSTFFPEYSPQHCKLQTCMSATAVVWACFSALELDVNLFHNRIFSPVPLQVFRSRELYTYYGRR